MTIYFLELSDMKKTVWALLDSRMGSVNVVRGVLQQLSPDKYDIIEKEIKYNAFAKLPNLIKGAGLLGITDESRKNLRSPFPDLVIAATRRTAPAARWIKKQSGGKTRIVQLLHPGPGAGLPDFDLVFVPEHDRDKQKSPNIVYTAGSPTRTTEQAMAAAQKIWEPVFASLPRPRTAVIVGGAVKGKPLSMDNAEGFAQKVLSLKKQIGGSILITDSWRTGDEARRRIMAVLKDIPAYTYLWGEKKDNPYMGYLACADNIIVSGDSVSMTCEACGTGRPVFIYCGRDWLTPKQQRFVQSLYDGGYAVSAEKDDMLSFVPSARLDVAHSVAGEIDRLFNI